MASDNSSQPALPVSRFTSGITKRELAAVLIAAGYASGVRSIGPGTSIAETAVRVADELFDQLEKSHDP